LASITRIRRSEGRLAAFADGNYEAAVELENGYRDRNHVMGDLRWDHEELTKGDPGFIYRTPEEDLR